MSTLPSAIRRHLAHFLNKTGRAGPSAELTRDLISSVPYRVLVTIPYIGTKDVKRIVEWLAEEGMEPIGISEELASSKISHEDRCVNFLRGLGYKIIRP